jgi:hypothetical protein
MEGRTIGGIVGVLLVVGLIFVPRLFNKSELEGQCHAAAYQLVAKCDKYRDHSGYIIDICDLAHEEAFGKAYKMGYGRRNRSTMDYGIYYDELFALMIERAESDNRKDIAESLDKLIDNVNNGTVKIPVGGA